jgi:hypothetical protein
MELARATATRRCCSGTSIGFFIIDVDLHLLEFFGRA